MFKTKKQILISSMGRSGSTWLADLINFNNRFNLVFEPFFPGRVKEAIPFGYYKYLDRASSDANLVDAARLLLSGNLKNDWLGTVRSRFRRGVLVKSIRTNLMLEWLKYQFPSLKIILLIRDPFDVARSWVRLNWSKIPFEDASDLDYIFKQSAVREFHPLFERWSKNYESMTHFESVILEWCVLNFIPLELLRYNPDHFLVVRYDELRKNPDRQLKAIFDYLEEPFTQKILEKVSIKSRTTFDKTLSDYEASDAEVKSSMDIISSFNLAGYLKDHGAKKAFTPEHEQKGK